MSLIQGTSGQAGEEGFPGEVGPRVCIDHMMLLWSHEGYCKSSLAYSLRFLTVSSLVQYVNTRLPLYTNVCSSCLYSHNVCVKCSIIQWKMPVLHCMKEEWNSNISEAVRPLYSITCHMMIFWSHDAITWSDRVFKVIQGKMASEDKLVLQSVILLSVVMLLRLVVVVTGWARQRRPRWWSWNSWSSGKKGDC